MRRRVLLSLAVPLVGGCLSPARPDAATGTDTVEELPPTGDGTPLQFDTGDPFQQRTIGEPADEGHRIVVWNDDADRRPLRVRLREAGGDEPVVSATPTFPAYGSFRVAVYRPADYVFEVGGPEGSDRRLGIRRTFVDCDDSATHVAVRPDGSVRARVVSMEIGCSDDPDS